MGKPTGFLEFTRENPKKIDPKIRVQGYNEFIQEMPETVLNNQAARCMDCGVPFCHSGCPLGNIIPEFNDAVYEKDYEEAYRILSSTNNFPEFTGRICPAPCEASCVLGINQAPVTIEEIEKNIIEIAFKKGYVVPHIPEHRTGKKIAVIGSGPAGLAAAAQLNSAGHLVTVFERDDEIGGLLRYGIPDFKLEKWVIQRRVDLMMQEGVIFKTNANVGVNVKTNQLVKDFDAVVLAGGSTIPRDIPIKGRELKGVHFAMEFLPQQNRRVAGKAAQEGKDLWATGQDVLVIGGGDTGADCVGTSHRHGAKSVTQIELLPKPPTDRTTSMPWPNWPMVLRTSSSHEEGGERSWSIQTKEFVGDSSGNLTGLKLVELEWEAGVDGKMPKFVEKAGSERIVPASLVLIAAGFLHPQQDGMLNDMGLDFDERGNVKANTTKYQTSNPKIFAAGDMRRGQSLVVWAISEGRECARSVDEYLMGISKLERKDNSLLNVEEMA
ncbi:MAG: glutamate synthase subunit beta [Opitutaceae bacterium]|nr:glutamate synthase subunit beta [Cytophagales bacterium]